ncbi:hypothetical protein PANT111_10226 [Pantoea brenneri]|uniref:Uncharacterized protein n=1 Tax=Pantoea brenneri TaxID=472694 RepID=A0AAX3IZX1_9GAMM|nr:hypothetical protein PANT111_10226 [Pantoea brenneri]
MLNKQVRGDELCIKHVSNVKPFRQNRLIYLVDLNRIISQIECDGFSFFINLMASPTGTIIVRNRTV